MRNIVLLLLLTAIAAFAQTGFAQQAPPSKAKKLNRAEVESLLTRPAEVLFIDVRRPDEISSIGGFAVYLSIQLKSLEKSLDSIPKDKLLVTVSNHAVRAGQAADLLDSKGFRVAGAVGVQNFEAEGGTVVKIPIPPPPAGATAKK